MPKPKKSKWMANFQFIPKKVHTAILTLNKDYATKYQKSNGYASKAKAYHRERATTRGDV